MHRRGWPADPGRDTGWAELVGCGVAGRSQPRRLEAPAVGGGGGAGPVDQAGLAVLAIAGPPAVGGGAGDAHLRSDMGRRPASGDALAQDEPSGWGEAGVNVGHEDLRVVSRQTAPPRPEVPLPVNTPWSVQLVF